MNCEKSILKTNNAHANDKTSSEEIKVPVASNKYENSKDNTNCDSECFNERIGTAFEIRIATLEDLQAIYKLEQECFTIPWTLKSLETDLTTNKNVATYLLAILDGNIVGYIGMWQVLDEAQVTNVCVLEEFRRKKIASKLIGSLINFAKEHSILQLTLEVRESNYTARNVYERAGFVEIFRRDNYYKDNGEDAIIMLKKN